MHQPIKNPCCRRAFLQGILASKGEMIDDAVVLSVENRERAMFISGLVREFFGREASVRVPETGGRCQILSFQSPAAIRYLTDLISEGGIHLNAKCSGCVPSVLRGIFFAIGHVSNPIKQYCLEFSTKNRTNIVLKYLESCGVYPKSAIRGGEEILYIKNSGAIEDFFALAGMNDATFAVMNSKIENEFRNNANRVANCETNNIGKAVSASLRQIAVIEKLERANLLSSLPEELERTARLRLAYRDLSLAQLAAVSVPPISKPGISHRMNRIVELADELLNKHNSH